MRFTPGTPILLTLSRDGSPAEPDCTCPVCAEAARSGQPMYTLGPDGDIIEMAPRTTPRMIEVIIRGTASTWPHFPPGPRTITVPVGCIIFDLLEYLCFQDMAIRLTYLPGDLYATIDGVLCEPDRVVQPGDRLTLHSAAGPAPLV